MFREGLNLYLSCAPLHCHQGKPHNLRTDNFHPYTSRTFDQFCNQLNIILTHGISHNLTEHTLVEQAHHTFKMCLLKQNQKMGPNLTHVNNDFNITLFPVNAVNVENEIIYCKAPMS